MPFQWQGMLGEFDRHWGNNLTLRRKDKRIMGFLERILRGAVRETVSRTVDKTVDKAIDNAFRNKSSNNGSYYNNNNQNSNGSYYNNGNNGYNSNNQNNSGYTSYGGNLNEGIAGEMYTILNSEFPGYDIRTQIAATALGAPDGCRAFDYGLYLNGTPVLMIMVTDHNRERNRAYNGAKQACANSGVKFMNFFTHMPNERSYVVNRIKSAL